jgi:hypothetical protein
VKGKNSGVQKSILDQNPLTFLCRAVVWCTVPN